MVKKYPYLRDIDFLNKIYDQHNRSSYVNITVLDWKERPLQDIKGRVTSASISINGDSAVRRTASLSIKILNDDELYTNIDSIFSINKKVFLETGLSNGFRHLGERYYPEYEVIWFPIGVMIIQSCNVSHGLDGVTVNLSLGDKMCLLNGEAGGVIPASTNFESVDTLGPDGDLHSEWLRINEIIPEMVHHFGGEELNNIIVSNIPDRIKQVIKWCGTNPLYIWESKDAYYNSVLPDSDPYAGNDQKRHMVFYTTISQNQFSKMIDDKLDEFSKRTIINNYDAGYIYTDFTYPGELGAGAGDTVCTVLDKIKNTLGNYEYFYDPFGHFIFQEVKNYINTSEYQSVFKSICADVEGTDPALYMPYGYNARIDAPLYEFDNKYLISCSNSPQFNMIKNDFIVWGMRKSATGQQLPCRYHLAIDERPDVSEPYQVDANICFDIDMNDKVKKCHIVDIVREGSAVIIKTLKALKYVYPQGQVGKYYAVFDKTKIVNGKEKIDFDHPSIYTWVTDVANYEAMLSAYSQEMEDNIVPLPSEESDNKGEGTSDSTHAPGYVLLPYATYYRQKKREPEEEPGENTCFTLPAGGEWRDRLYFYGLVDSMNGLDTNYYFTELVNEWPKLYDVENHRYYQEVTDSPTSLDYWLDIIDNDAILNEFSVNNIGRRSYAKTESGCNCVFEPMIPDYIIVDTGNTESVVDSRTAEMIEEARDMGMPLVQVEPAIYNSMMTGGTYNSCYENVRQLIQDYTDYNNSISITCLPIYHLEPNTRIYINDPDSGVHGEYLINTISYSLGNEGTMSISAKKINRKI